MTIVQLLGATSAHRMYLCTQQYTVPSSGVDVVIVSCNSHASPCHSITFSSLGTDTQMARMCRNSPFSHCLKKKKHAAKGNFCCQLSRCVVLKRWIRVCVFKWGMLGAVSMMRWLGRRPDRSWVRTCPVHREPAPCTVACLHHCSVVIRNTWVGQSSGDSVEEGWTTGSRSIWIPLTLVIFPLVPTWGPHLWFEWDYYWMNCHNFGESV